MDELVAWLALRKQNKQIADKRTDFVGSVLLAALIGVIFLILSLDP